MPLFTRAIALRRIRDMQRVLAGPDEVITRALARLANRITRRSIVTVAAEALGSITLTRAPKGADTS